MIEVIEDKSDMVSGSVADKSTGDQGVEEIEEDPTDRIDALRKTLKLCASIDAAIVGTSTVIKRPWKDSCAKADDAIALAKEQDLSLKSRRGFGGRPSMPPVMWARMKDRSKQASMVA